MDNHEEEKKSLIEKPHAAGGGANLTAGLNAPNCRGEIVAAKTRDEQAAIRSSQSTTKECPRCHYYFKSAVCPYCADKLTASPKSWWDYIKTSGLVLGTLALGGALLFLYASVAIVALGFILVALTRNWKD